MLTTEAKNLIEKRGWAKDDYEALGIYSEGNMVYFPLISYTGEVVGTVGRDIKSKQFAITLKKHSFGYFLWRGMNTERVLFLVEGIFDVSWLLASGFHAAAYLSNSLSNGQVRLISRFYDKVVVMPDTDVEGIRGGIQAVKRLEKAGVKRVKSFAFQGYKDVGEAFESGAKREIFVGHLRKIESSLMAEDGEGGDHGSLS